MINLLQTNELFFLCVVFFFSLAIGSFLNVVIHRLPKMMNIDWQEQCHELLELEANKESSTYNLSYPRSHCPSCQHQISALENIPIISYLLLKGQCSDCKISISARYPLVELFTGLISVLIAWHFGFSWQTALALPLVWALISLSFIDFDTQLLPDQIIYPFLWLGLLANSQGLFTDLNSAVIGAAVGYLSLWSVFQLFKLITKKDGMGYGDFKLMALFGAWLGWQSLFQIILLSSLVGAIAGVSLILILGRDKNIPIPFGPYIASAGLISLLTGMQITQAYLQWAGLA